MPSATFDKSQGLTVGLSSNTSFNINPKSWSWAGVKGTEIDSTTLDDTTYMSSDRGLTDPGEVSFDFKVILSQIKTNWNAVIASDIQTLTLTFVAGGGYSVRKLIFPIYCSSFSVKGDTNQQMEGSITFKVTGAPTQTMTV